MSITILEVLQNAEINIVKNFPRGGILAITLGKAQLHNAVTLLEKGYSLSEEIGPILDQYPDVEDAPEKKT